MTARTGDPDRALCTALSRRADDLPETARYFGNLASSTGSQWREFASFEERSAAYTGDNLNEVADVWNFSPEGVVVRMEFTSTSGDWRDEVEYCFRADASLAVTDSELRTFSGGMVVDRTSVFDAVGRGREVKRTYRDLLTDQPTDANGVEGLGYQDHPVPQYLTVSALPFPVQ